ncbi:hypothetical protein [Streptococcus gallinaceus]|uniref:YolD-like protein n=1 Tax=Streptococcus gallinaceus TaxID=165758 RepID=A0ABV2JKM4_9STRE|nr:hypothetical protein [Streptococcus gallinaceus]MCP1638389.1 hypothetical protein [Streptococcus gallinaceus]MCP1769524.1 hypothetical protein [Streptococcus gallinaceus]CRH92170.1 Uncharacterised protein [Chlamydia trachomatis]
MKKFIEPLLDQMKVFLGTKTAPTPISDQEELEAVLLQTIETAIHQHTAVHVIYGQKKSFTGEIVKFDRERKHLVMKNFSKNMGSIIHLNEIKRISPVPEPIRKSQKSVGQKS